MTRLKTLLAATFLAAVPAAAAAAPLNEVAPKSIDANEAGGTDAVAPFLQSLGYSEAATDALVETRRHVSPTSGRTYVTYEQRLVGWPIHASYVRAVIEPDGTLSQVIHRIADLEAGVRAMPLIAAEPVLASTIGHVSGLPTARVKARSFGRTTFEKGDDYQIDPTAEAVFVADEDGSLSPATLVRAWAKRDNALTHTLIGSDGRVLDQEDRTADDSYIAYRIHPGAGNATVIGGTSNRTASPEGWLGSQAQYERRIGGNNVEAYVDANADNAPDNAGARVWNGVFDTMPDLGGDPTSNRNKAAAVQNLFYQVNDIHDRLYRHGFTETAGNFQRDNFGRGGVGGDQIQAEVLDGSGTNNANIAVPTNDGTYYGQGPRMQMYRWTGANPDRASSLDGDIVWHEYGHGVLWRMVGDLDWPISWALNEGFADALAIVATGDDRVGEWASGRSSGIRSARYGSTGKRLGSYRSGKSNAHTNGEIYAAAIWAVREEWRRAGRSDDDLLGLMIEGLNKTRPRATFIDMREGLLDAGDSQADCRVWRGFAKVGMGEGATMSWSGSKGSPNVNVRESYRVPSRCAATKAPSPAPAPAPQPSGDWAKCASEGGYCRVSGTKTVRYGASGSWITKQVTNGIACTNAAFGRDPAKGTRKTCEVQDAATQPQPSGDWAECASEGGYCRVSGTKTVRYGASGSWITKQVTNGIACTNAAFGRDPAKGTRKTCEVRG